MDLCEDCLCTDDSQFGFKKGTGCTNALFVLTETVKYFIENGSSTFLAALDLKKAFDRVNHFKLFTALLKGGIKLWIVSLLVDWYSKLTVSVRWDNILSYNCKINSGVRQGSALSPALFNFFVNPCLMKPSVPVQAVKLVINLLVLICMLMIFYYCLQLFLVYKNF